MLDQSSVRELLRPFELGLSPDQIGQLLTYLDLLMRWNDKINLTSIRNPEEIVTRHFGESLYLARIFRPRGSLLDIGSGAGFPGLALQITFPDLGATLLEPVAKKRAFLKEAARTCGFRSVEVRPERLDEFVVTGRGGSFNIITARAVGHFESLVPEAEKHLDANGQICLWIGQQQGNELRRCSSRIEWENPVSLPLGREREIWVGRLKAKAGQTPETSPKA